MLFSQSQKLTMNMAELDFMGVPLESLTVKNGRRMDALSLAMMMMMMMMTSTSMVDPFLYSDKLGLSMKTHGSLHWSLYCGVTGYI